MAKDKQAKSNSKQISNLFYSGEEARQKLGMTRGSFNYYVRQGTIKATKLAGRARKYAKKDIDMMALSLASAMIISQAPEIELRKATLDNQEHEFELAVLNFGEQTKQYHPKRRSLLEKNPDMSYYLFDRDFMVASINVVPLDPQGIRKFQAGERGWNLGEHVVQYEPGKPLEILIIDFMTTPLAPANRRTQYAVHLLQGLARLMEGLGDRGVEIVRIHACGATDQGRRLLETAGFIKLAEFGQRHIYMLEIERSNLHMLQAYKVKLQAFKDAQGK